RRADPDPGDHERAHPCLRQERDGGRARHGHRQFLRVGGRPRFRDRRPPRTLRPALGPLVRDDDRPRRVRRARDPPGAERHHDRGHLRLDDHERLKLHVLPLRTGPRGPDADLCLDSTLTLRRITNPGGTPAISGNLTLTVPTTSPPIAQVQPSPSRTLDGLDERLLAAMIHTNKITGARTLWTAHNMQVDESGVAIACGPP